MNQEARDIGITESLAHWFASIVKDGDPERTLRDILVKAMNRQIEREHGHA
jgi:hypothetical protein